MVAVLAAGLVWSAATVLTGACASLSTPLSNAERLRAENIFLNACAGCHGLQLESAVGPALQEVGLRYSPEKIERIIQRGKGKRKAVPMLASLASDEDASLLARWLARSS